MTRLGAVLTCAALAAFGCSGDDDSSNTKSSSSDKQHAHKDAGSGSESDASTSGDDSSPGCGCAGNGGFKTVDRTKLTNVGTTEPLDYDDPGNWVCRIDLHPNECHRNIDATEILPDGVQNVVKHMTATSPKFDCFYVYPTVLLDGSANMTDFSQAGVDLVLDPLLSQAAPFTSLCEVYAPLYRQNGLSSTGAPVTGGNATLGLQDVRDAFKYYLAAFRQPPQVRADRPLAGLVHADVADADGHRRQARSPRQIDLGAADRRRRDGARRQAGRWLVQERPAVQQAGRDRLRDRVQQLRQGRAAAGHVRVRSRQRRQRSRVHRACAARGQLRQVHGSTSPRTPTTRRSSPTPSPTGVTTTFVLYRDEFSGKCVTENGYTYHQVTLDPPDGDRRGTPPVRSTILESIGFGLHLVDYNIPLTDLIGAVTMQADNALK